MKLVLISDTHRRHDLLYLPPGDVLVHAGDFSGRGKPNEVTEFLAWFASRPHPHKVFIAGNHDFLAEREPQLFASLLPPGVIYLNDSGTEIEGLKIWGSPVQPEFFNWAFNRKRGPEIRRHWELIPPGTDVLITHGPPLGVLDQVKDGPRVGCTDLLEVVQEIRPRVHVFGHIHEGYGQVLQNETLFVNASVLNENYQLVNAPVTVEL